MIDWKKWNRQERIERLKRLLCFVGHHRWVGHYGELSSCGVDINECSRCFKQTWRARL